MEEGRVVRERGRDRERDIILTSNLGPSPVEVIRGKVKVKVNST